MFSLVNILQSQNTQTSSHHYPCFTQGVSSSSNILPRHTLQGSNPLSVDNSQSLSNSALQLNGWRNKLSEIENSNEGSWHSNQIKRKALKEFLSYYYSSDDCNNKISFRDLKKILNPLGISSPSITTVKAEINLENRVANGHKDIQLALEKLKKIPIKRSVDNYFLSEGTKKALKSFLKNEVNSSSGITIQQIAAVTRISIPTLLKLSTDNTNFSNNFEPHGLTAPPEQPMTPPSEEDEIIDVVS